MVQQLHGAEVDLLVSAHGVVHGLFVFGKRGGVEDDEIPCFGAGFEVVEDVGFDGFDREIAGAGVFLHAGDGFAGNVDAGDVSSTGFGASEAEASLVGEAVKDAESFAEAGDLLVGVELVEIESGLLSLQEIEVKGDVVEVHRDLAGVVAVNDGNFGCESFGFSDGGVVSQNDGSGLEDLDQGGDDEIFALVHGEGEGLEDEVLAVAVDDDAGEAVGLAPDGTRELRIDIEMRAEFLSLLDAPDEKVVVEGLFSPREAPGDDLGGGIVNSGAEGTVLEVLEANDFAGFRGAEGLANLARIDPIVSVEDASAGHDNQSWHKI